MYMIYGVSDCPHCLRAQALCMEKDIEYVWVNMDWSKDFREKKKKHFKWKTYPIITRLHPYVEDLVGGTDAVQEHVAGDLVDRVVTADVFHVDQRPVALA